MNKPLSDETKVKIVYPDTGEEKTITLGQLREFLKSEPYEWRDKFFKMLETTGSAYGRILKYSIVK